MSSGTREGMPAGARARHRADMRQLVRRSLTLTTLSTVVPGLGLAWTRYRRLGWLTVAVTVLVGLVGTGAVLFYGATQAVLAIAVRPSVLLAVAGGLLLVGMVWIFCVLLTHRDTMDARFDRRQRWELRLFTALMCLLVAVPVGQAARYALIQRDVVDVVFSASGDRADSGAAKPTSGSDPWAGVGRVNVLLIGSDAGDDRIGIRTDSMIVASIDAATGQTVLLSLPRNLENVPFPTGNPLSKLWPNGYNCGDECLLNAVWNEAVNHKDLFKNDSDPGLTTVRGVIQEVLGQPIDYSVVIDLAGFQSLVDAMGGVVVDVKERLPVQGAINSSGALYNVEGWIDPGVQRLDGYHALWYARSRVLSDDYSRMRRQRCLVSDIVNQVNPTMMLQKYPDLARVAQQNIVTDIPATDLPAWVDLVDRVKNAQIHSLTFTASNVSVTHPDFAKIRALVRQSIAASLAPEASTTTAAPSATTASPTTKPGSTKSGASRTPSPTTSATPSSDALVDVAQAC
ncbi:MAG: LCP family protein [Dermatophilaceae bacterium]